MKKDSSVIKQAHIVLDNYIKRRSLTSIKNPNTTHSQKPSKELHSIPVFPLAALTVIFTVLCIINIVMWFAI